MKKHLSLFVIGCIVLITSCAPKVSTIISKNYSALDYREGVRVFGIQDPAPTNSEDLGIVTITDTGFSTNCGLDVVTEKAKNEARKVGGNAIKITDHIPPSIMGSSCHRIKAKILKVENLDSVQIVQKVDSTLLNANYALLHVYRHSGAGALVSYDLYLGDSVICRVNNKWKESIRIRKDGLNTLWARTETKVEIPINIKFGNEYYIRCGVAMGAFVGRPQIQITDNQTGKSEFQSIALKGAFKKDLILLNDGREIECIINSEDSDNVYFTIVKDDREIKTLMKKEQIKSIKRRD